MQAVWGVSGRFCHTEVGTVARLGAGTVLVIGGNLGEQRTTHRPCLRASATLRPARAASYAVRVPTAIDVRDAEGGIDPLLADAVAALTGRRIAALTGAGISTDSGIPDYRGPNSPARTPITYQQFVHDPAFRRHYWARNHLGWRHVHRTQPNAGHLALARMESTGALHGLITQNVDLLHQRAGSRAVIDLHGTYAQVVCLACEHRTTRVQLAARLEELNAGFADSIAEIHDVEIAPDADAVIAT